MAKSSFIKKPLPHKPNGYAVLITTMIIGLGLMVITFQASKDSWDIIQTQIHNNKVLQSRWLMYSCLDKSRLLINQGNNPVTDIIFDPYNECKTQNIDMNNSVYTLTVTTEAVQLLLVWQIDLDPATLQIINIKKLTSEET